MAESAQAFVTLGRIVRPHGIRGEVRIRPYGDDPAVFAELGTLDLVGHGSRRVLRARPHGAVGIVLLEGVATMNEAQALVGVEVGVPRERLPELEADDDEWYWVDLIGCRVVDAARGDLGVVRELFETAAHPNLVVAREGKAEGLIPFVEAFIREVDLEARRIDVELPEGLLED